MKKFNNYYLILFLILYLLALWLFFNYIKIRVTIFKKNKKEINIPLIVCLMITGKNEERLKFARQSINNFKEQTYPNKKLFIINHNENSFEEPADNDNHVFHIQIKKEKGVTLGKMRNISLEFVPKNAYWTIWDDDDVRSDNYLSILYDKLIENNADCISLINRYEYNIQTKLAWKMNLKSGFSFVLCKQNTNIQYLDRDTMEDIELLKDIRKMNMKVFLYDNDPSLYVRIVHENNTSLYVNKHKKHLKKNNSSNYSELDVSREESIFIKKQVDKLF